MSFTNTILVIHYNYAKFIDNRFFLNDLYQPYFKKIYHVSNLPTYDCDDVIFIDTNKGYLAYKVSHLSLL
jgi:hypothetical protein